MKKKEMKVSKVSKNKIQNENITITKR